jgi:hypothetical protein
VGINISCSVVCWLLHCTLLLLLFAACFSLTTFAVHHFVIGWLLGCAVLHLLFAFAVACFPLATFADPRSVVGWLLRQMPLLLLYALVRRLLPPCYHCRSLVLHWLDVASCTAAPPLCFRHRLLPPCYLCRSLLSFWLVVS